MKYIFFIFLSLFSFISFCGCAGSGGSSPSSTTFADAAPSDPVYVYKILGNGVQVATDIYTDFGLDSQTETGSGIIAVMGEQDFTFNGNNTLGQVALRSNGTIEVQLYRNGVLVDDQTESINGNSLTFRSDL